MRSFFLVLTALAVAARADEKCVRVAAETTIASAPDAPRSAVSRTHCPAPANLGMIEALGVPRIECGP